VFACAAIYITLSGIASRQISFKPAANLQESEYDRTVDGEPGGPERCAARTGYESPLGEVQDLELLAEL